MNDIKNILRDVGYFGVGAAAVILEAGGKVVKSLVRKGEKTLQDNQDTVEDLKRKARDLGAKVKEAVEKATAPSETPVDDAAEAPAEPCCEAEAPCDTCAEEVVPVYQAEAPCEGDAPCQSDEACSEDVPVVEEPAVPVVEEPAPPVVEEPAIEEDPRQSCNG